MLSIFSIAGCVLIICTGPPVSGYTVATVSGSRGQDYSGSYRTTGGFVGMKDSQADYSENPSSHRYSSIGSGGGGGGGGSGYSSTTGSSYGSDSGGYGDSGLVGSHVSYQSSGNSGANQALSSSYSSDLGGQGGGSSELVGASYTTGGGSSPGGLSGYSSPGTSGSGVSQQGASSLSEYSESSIGGHGSGGFSLPNEYSSPGSSRPGNSYVSYAISGPKAAAYTSSGASHPAQGQTQSHGASPYSSSTGISFSGGNHRPITSSSSSSSSYPSEINQHPGISSGPPNYASAQSLKGFLASMHGPNNYIPHGPHRGSPNHHIYSSASNHLPGYTSRGPTPGYFPGNSPPYPRGSGGPNGKIIIVKESSGGGGGHHSPHMFASGDHHSYPNVMFGSPNSGYKIRNLAGSASSHGPPSFAGGYSSSSNTYSNPSSSASSNSNSNLASSFFSFL